MSILTADGKIMITNKLYLVKYSFIGGLLAAVMMLLMPGCERPKEDIVLRQVRDVVADATTEPMLKAEALFYNPNNVGGKLRNIDVEIFVNGKKAGEVNKDYKIRIPPNGEFTVPLEVKLNMKELGILDTILGMLGGKKFDVEYKGRIKLLYRGFPVSFPVDYKSQIRVSF
jgi:LEA14-like dessication related protein